MGSLSIVSLRALLVICGRPSLATARRCGELGRLYRKRKWIVEAPNGWIKNVLGFRQFSLRGLEKVKAEFKLVCLALNLRRMSGMRAS